MDLYGQYPYLMNRDSVEVNDQIWKATDANAG